MSRQHHFQLTQSYRKLRDFLPQLTERYKPERVICFHCSSTSSLSYGCFKYQSNTYSIHYFLLMVTSPANRVEHEAQDYANSHFHAGAITLLVHSREAAEANIREGNSFFTTVYRDGVVLYTADIFTLPALELPESDDQALLAKAKYYYEVKSGMIKGFIRSADAAMEQQHYSVAVFLLHQAAEQCGIVLISVYLGYRADIHHIGRLLDLCRCFSDKPAEVFARRSNQEKRLFGVLTKSYSASRYNNEFSICSEDAQSIFRLVNDFVTLTTALCLKHIKELTEAAEEAAINHPDVPAGLIPGLTATND